MSHRYHHGPLITAHTERDPATVGTVCLALLVLLLVLALAGCATTTVTCSNLERGACTVSSTRLLTDSGVALNSPDGLALNFSSKPNEAGTAAAFKALGDTITLLGRVVAAKAVPDQPTTPTTPPVLVPPPLPPPNFPRALEAPEP